MTQLSLMQTSAEDRSLLHLNYGLMSAFPLLLPLLLGLALNLSLTKGYSGPLGRSHLRWQRHSMLGLVLLFPLSYNLPHGGAALVLMSLTLMWFVMRILKGWVSLIDGIAP